MTDPLPESDRPVAAAEPPPPVLGRGLAGVLAMLGAIGLLVLVDLLGAVVAGHAGVMGGGGLLAVLPAPLGTWLAPPPTQLGNPVGLAALAALALLVASCGHGVARGDVARAAGTLDLAALLAVGVAWAPLAGAVVGGQALFMALAGWINRGRGPEGGALVPGVTQAARLLGLVAAILLVATPPPALAVTMLVAALAPWALARLLFGRVAAPPVRACRGPEAVPVGGPVAAPPPPPPAMVPEEDAAWDPAPVAVVEAPSLARPVPAPAVGPFGADPAADVAHLVSAAALGQAASAALEGGGGAILAVIRVDGLAGIAEHLGATGGGILFTETSGRLAEALPDSALLAWMGDETFAALVPVADTGSGAARADVDDVLGGLGHGLAAPFAAEMIVEGRSISMEDAIHVEATALQGEMLPDLVQWAGAAPGG